MQVWFEGAGWLEVPGDLPQAVAYDPALPHAGRSAAVNRGCPNGYVAEFISDGHGGSESVCRLMDTPYVTDPSVRAAETANVWSDYVNLFADAISPPNVLHLFFTEGVPEVIQYAAKIAGQVASGIGTAAGGILAPVSQAVSGTVKWLAVGLIALVALRFGGRGKGR